MLSCLGPQVDEADGVQPVGCDVPTVLVTDTGGVTNGGSNTLTRTFAITVTPVNQVPTLTALSNATISENAAVQTVQLSGISAGLGDTALQQFLTVVATSSWISLRENPSITAAFSAGARRPCTSPTFSSGSAATSVS